MKPSTIVQPDALFDPRGRQRLAAMVVWGKRGLTRHQIENRLVKVLERMARKLLETSQVDSRKAA